ncbi:MAG: bile acid:sodium symporter family protein [Gammaproteobacteria bacterium]
MESTNLTAVFLPVALAVIMLGMGLSLQPVHFRQIIIAPKPVFTGLAMQIIVLPLLAGVIAWILNLPPALAVGLVLIAACPGGATSNLITHLARGDSALSISLTALSSLIIIVTLPLVVNYASLIFMEAGQQVPLPVVKTILQILIITVIPVAIGMLLRARFTAFADKADKPVKVLSALFLALVIAGILVGEKDTMPGFFVMVGSAALLLNLVCMLAGYIAAKSARLVGPQVRTIVIEVGIQNGTLGIAVASTLIGNNTMAIPAAVYSLIMFVTGAAIILWGNIRK